MTDNRSSDCTNPNGTSTDNTNWPSNPLPQLELESFEIQKLEGFRQRLQDINSSGAYINKLSQEILLSEKTGLAKYYIEVWSTAIINEKSPSKIIALFYVINDFIQLSHLNSRELIQITIPHLRNVCESISKGDNFNSILEECQRVISIWRARCIFEDRTICLSLTKLLQGQSDAFTNFDYAEIANDFDEENSSKKKLRLLQLDGENRDGYIAPFARLITQNYEVSNQDKHFALQVSQQLKSIHDLRRQLVEKVYFGRKIDLEIDELLLKHNHISKQSQSVSSSAIELEDVHKVLKQNRAKQKVLIQKQWEIRQKLHDSLEALCTIIEGRIESLYKIHHEAHKNLFKIKSLSMKNSS